MAVIGEVAAAAAEAVAEAASTMNVVGHFGSAAQEVRTADLPRPATTSFVPDQHEVAEAVEEEFESVEVVVVDDRPTVAGSGSHKTPVKNSITVNTTMGIYNT